jgi:hypothetical protein
VADAARRTRWPHPGDDKIHPEVVAGLWEGLVHHLKRVDRGGQDRVGPDHASLDEEGDLEVGESSALADASALAVHGHAAAYHSVREMSSTIDTSGTRRRRTGWRYRPPYRSSEQQSRSTSTRKGRPIGDPWTAEQLAFTEERASLWDVHYSKHFWGIGIYEVIKPLLASFNSVCRNRSTPRRNPYRRPLQPYWCPSTVSSSSATTWCRACRATYGRRTTRSASIGRAMPMPTRGVRGRPLLKTPVGASGRGMCG